MFKKSLFTLLSLGIIVVLVYGVTGTGAWFTDAAEITGNSVSTGTLDLVVSGGPFNATNLEPGAPAKSIGQFCVTNGGTYDMKWRGWLYDVVDPAGLKNYLMVSAVMNPDGSSGWNYGSANLPLFTDVPFNNLTAPNTYILMDDPVWAFGPGKVACYEIKVALASNAPNAVQGAQLDVKLYFEGTQRINTGWGQ